MSFRDEFGQWDPKNQRPELWNLYNARVAIGREHPRLPDQQLDRTRRVAVHPARAAGTAIDLLRPHRPVVRKNGLLPVTELTPAKDGDVVEGRAGALPHRGDITCTAPVVIRRGHRGRSSPRRRPPRSPSAVRRGWTTRPRRRRWSNARGRLLLRSALVAATPTLRTSRHDLWNQPCPPSSTSPNRQRLAALSHLRQRRRRQEHLIGRLLYRHQDHPRRHPQRHRKPRPSAA